MKASKDSGDRRYLAKRRIANKRNGGRTRSQEEYHDRDLRDTRYQKLLAREKALETAQHRLEAFERLYAQQRATAEQQRIKYERQRALENARATEQARQARHLFELKLIVQAREDELAEMRNLQEAWPGYSADKNIRLRTGLDDHLELGIGKPPSFDPLKAESWLRLPVSENVRTGRRRKIPQAVIIQVVLRDRGRCCYCGSPEKLQFDHKLPWSRGGEDTVDNVQLLCEPCNLSKGNRW